MAYYLVSFEADLSVYIAFPDVQLTDVVDVYKASTSLHNFDVKFTDDGATEVS